MKRNILIANVTAALTVAAFFGCSNMTGSEAPGSQDELSTDDVGDADDLLEFR